MQSVADNPVERLTLSRLQHLADIEKVVYQLAVQPLPNFSKLAHLRSNRYTVRLSRGQQVG
jgi:hypothetical protein